MFDEDLFDTVVEEDPKVLLLLEEDTNAYPEAAGRARREMKLENFILIYIVMYVEGVRYLCSYCIDRLESQINNNCGIEVRRD